MIRFIGLACLATLLSVAGGAFGQPLRLDRLQRLLQDAPRTDVRFTELRESRWLAEPLESSGTMRASSSELEKRVEQPRREIWRILGDRIQLSVPGSPDAKEIRLDDVPAAAALSHTLRHLMAGNIDALNKDFALGLAGEERDWSLQLTPRQQEVARHLRQIDVRGAGGRLTSIAVVERQGDRTTTRLYYSP